jgi:hypothetical protein
VNSSGQSSPLDFNRIISGVIRAARLDRTFFAEVERDTSYNIDSLAVVVIAALASGIGSFFNKILFGGSFVQSVFSLVWGVVWAIAGFYLWCFLVSWVGKQFFKGQGDWGEVQRCLGFAYGPQVLGILAVIPCVGWLAALAGWIWSMVAGFVAVQEALDQDTTNALLTVVISGVIVLIVGAVIGSILGVGVFVGRSILGGVG